MAGVGIGVAGLGGHLARATANEIQASDHAMEPALRAYLVAAAESGGRASALLGLANLAGVAPGFVLLLLEIRARREAMPPVPSAAAEKTPPTTPVFVWLFGSTLLILIGLVVAIPAYFLAAYFLGRVSSFLLDMQTSSIQFLDAMTDLEERIAGRSERVDMIGGDSP